MNPGSRKSDRGALTSEHLGLLGDSCPHVPVKEAPHHHHHLFSKIREVIVPIGVFPFSQQMFIEC